MLVVLEYSDNYNMNLASQRYVQILWTLMSSNVVFCFGPLNLFGDIHERTNTLGQYI